MSFQPTALFRKESVLHKVPSLFNGAVIKFDAAATVVAMVAFFAALGLMLTVFLGMYERRERVSGYVAPMNGLVRVLPPRVGVITRLDVADGQDVSVGDSLFSVSSLRGTQSSADADMEQVEVLDREKANINARIAREGLLAEIRIQDIRRRISESDRQSRSIQNQQDLAQQHAVLITRELARLEALREGGHVSASLMDERRVELLAAQKTVTAFGREFDRLQAEIAALKSELEIIPLQLGAREKELQGRLLEIERMLTEAEVQRETIVRAPISGRVTSLVAFPGQSVTPNQAMLAILPDDTRLQAVLLVPSHAAGFIQPGQQVRLRYDAFPHQRFGVHAGVVYSVSRTMLNPGDHVGPLLLQTPAYRVIATLDSESVMAYGEAIPLTPDLTLQADVVRDRMRIIEWIFDPVRAAVSAL